ncbi:insulinase family protein [Desulfobulbus rhabdoformis]|uniref:M16 family metallopeptidase n=1 Tax=Desulfobulbus rhabdoformis TaxID=34032 RepID=UPI0019631525|nr:M16 family metallopeptidase [Desulfobulbus rhabdoformis]MBM9616041.1 insulinase family protein [Desulfobulbus rhabdoformis]
MRYPRQQTAFFLLVLLGMLSGLLLLSPRLQAANQAPCLTSGWPHESSELQPDPSLVFGQLDNGLRYVLKTNHTPKNRVAMYLNVQSGSLRETEAQRGLAHFLEHMLFNGTTHYPPGTLVEYFQSLGMGFGGDTNAHTGFDETVYNLLLPTNGKDVIAEGFQVLADYARGALLLEGEVDKERGVILSEKRSRDSAASRVSKKQMQFDFKGSLVAKRFPIGLESVIKQADAKLLRSYYDRWYRPENIIVVVVGDMDPSMVEPLLAKAFSPLRGVGEVGECPDYGQVAEKGTDVLVLPEQELGYTELSLGTVFNEQPQAETKGWEEKQLKRYLGVHLFANRLKKMGEDPKSPLAQLSIHGGNFLNHYGVASLSGRVNNGRWREGLQQLHTALAQIQRDGFDQKELERGKREIMAMLRKAVQTSSTRDSRALAGEIIQKLNSQEVVLSPEQEMQLYGDTLKQTTLDDVNEVMQALWKHPRRLIEVVGIMPPELQGGGADDLVRDAYKTAIQVAPAPWVREKSGQFPYLTPPAELPGSWKKEQGNPAIGVQSYRLGQGVTLHIKPTEYQANQVALSVLFGQGKLAAPHKGMVLLAQDVVNGSGLGQLTKAQLQSQLAGSNLQLDFRIGAESFAFEGTALTGEFERLLQLVYHYLKDPAFREDAYLRSREKLEQMYRQMETTVVGTQQTLGERYLSGSRAEYTLATWDEVAAIDLNQIQSWLQPALFDAPLEINVVGDITPQQALELINRYFGNEKRMSPPITRTPKADFPFGATKHIQVVSSIDKALITVAWKTNDFWDISRTRRLSLLAAILDDRLRVKIREELGATYSPQVNSAPSRAHDGFGLLRSSLIVAPEQAETLAQTIKEVADSLVQQGVGEEELQRALKPILTSIKDIKEDNRYWMESVLKLSSRHPQQLVWPESILEEYAAIQADDVTALARQYLRPELAATVIISPVAAGKTDNLNP